MAAQDERERLKALYKSKKWWDKVDKMTDSQAIAVFKRLRQQQKV
jgi:hypothetical protein